MHKPLIFFATLFLLTVILALGSSVALSAPYGAKWNDVSEYLIGTVYVKVFFLESDKNSPNTENWTEQEKTNCAEALEKALDEIRRRFIREFEMEAGSGELHPGVNLEFIVDYETVKVSVEPIKLRGSGVVFSRGDLKLWVNEVMSEKGFAGKTPARGPRPILPYPPYQYNVAEYADSLRNEFGTDWATVIFFYDNSDDEDGKFSNRKSAGPPMGVGGPGLHFSSNRGRPFIERKKTLQGPNSYIGLIHEFLHVWYALDEHPGNKHFRKDAVSGYLGSQNRNYKMGLGKKCSMYSANRYWPELCDHTLQQIGWWDNDNDYIPDILDVSPVVSLSPDPEGGIRSYAGRAFSPPLPNVNPYSEGGTIKPPHDLSVVLHLVPTPERRLGIKHFFKKIPEFKPPFPWTRNDITINTIISVEYRILKNGKIINDWTDAEPEDGAFDYAEEQFTFTLKTPGPGTYTVELRSRNSVHLYSDILKVDVKVAH